MSQSPTELEEFDYQSSYTDAASQLNKLVRSGKSYSGHERNRCFLNVKGKQFANASMISGFDFPEDGRAIAVCDWDGDGDQDFWVANRTAPQLRLMQNQLGHQNRSVRFQLRGTKSNRDAIGAKITIQIARNSLDLHRTLRAGEGFLTCHSKEVHFGVGDARRITKVSVRWPSGDSEIFAEANDTGRTYRLEEGKGVAQLVKVHAAVRNTGDDSSNELVVPQQTMGTHNLLMQPAPIPPLMYESTDGSLVDASVANEKPTLINLWAQWCVPCIEEIESWSKDYVELKDHVDLLALSVDKLSDDGHSDGTEVLEKLGYRGQYGWASSDLLDILQQTHNVIYDHHRPLPLPVSILLDRQGNLCAIYKGPVESDRILRDVSAITSNETREQTLPFAGRWMGPLGSHNVQLIVEELFREGYETEAQAYVERLTDDTFKIRQIGSRLFLAQELATRDPVAARRHLTSVLKLSPDDPKAHEQLGLVYARAGNGGEAKKHFTLAIQNQKVPEPRTYYNFGKLLRGQGATSEAWEQFRKAIEVDSRFHLAYEQLGLIRASQRQFADAAKLFGSAVAIRPSKPSYRVNQAMAFTQLQRDADAWKTIQPIIDQADVPPMALLLGARSLGNLKRFTEAIPLLERFLERETGAADVRQQLKYMREQEEKSR